VTARSLKDTLGGSWEGFVIEQLLVGLPKANAYYWRTQAGAELVLLLFAPTVTSSMVSALKGLELNRLLVDYPGSARYTLHSKVEVIRWRSAWPNWLDFEIREIAEGLE
jgi:predicted AAA+ superfamily ATPase